MAKKLKKKVEELCGLEDLQWEERRAKAESILASSERKQELCNQLQGLSFRELEKVLKSVIAERQVKEVEEGTTSKSRTAHLYRSKEEQKKNPGRSLADILKQVYAPRETHGGQIFTRSERDLYQSSKGADLHEEIFCDSLSIDSEETGY